MPLLAQAAQAPTPNLAPQIPAQLTRICDQKTLKTVESDISTNSIPVVSLDVEAITDAVAARLATSLIGHILFLKGQVPLPVMQLSRISSAKSTVRALKQRNDLLASFDTLTSHLNTTFTALSSALAQAPEQINTSLETQEDIPSAKPKCPRVYLAVFVGSSTASAKSKVIYAVDGLETKAIGARDDVTNDNTDVEPRREQEAYEENDEDDQGDHEDEEEDEDEDEDGEEDHNEEEDVDTDDEPEDGDSDELASSPPESRSPSPEPPSYPTATHAEQQRALHAAERLLSRTLAAADAEGNGMSADMAPTQTHILLRAPRRFVHPAWIPRQNISVSLESTLDEFLEESGIRLPDTQLPKRKKVQKKGKTVEGVWVTYKGGLDTEVGKDGVGGRLGDDEWDDMIWWSWDGKIIGFSEW